MSTNHNIIECDEAERDLGVGVCGSEPSLAILKEVHKLYERKMELIDKAGGGNKLQRQVDLLRSWVGDLFAQNTLLARTVEELEAEAITKLIIERNKHEEVVSEFQTEVIALRRRLARKDSDLRGLIEVLRRLREFDDGTMDGIHFFEVTESDVFGSRDWHSANTCGRLCELKVMNESLIKENMAKDREIMQLNKNIQDHEQTIAELQNEVSITRYHTPEVSRKDAEVMAATGDECGEWEPVKDFSELLRAETANFQERIYQMETKLKMSSDSLRSLREVNVTLTEEMHAMRRMCAALVEESQSAIVRAQFKDDIIREMRRQLKQAKAKLKEVAEVTSVQSKDFVSGDGECPRGSSVSYDSVTIACVRAQPRRKRDVPMRVISHQNVHDAVAGDFIRDNVQRDITTKNVFDKFCDDPSVPCLETAGNLECGQKTDCEYEDTLNVV